MAQKEWLTEDEAIERLKRQRTTLRRFARNGVLKTQMQRLPGKNRDQTMYHAGDIERLAGDPEALSQVAKEVSPNRALVVAPRTAVLAPRSPGGSAYMEFPATSKLFLTRTEAAVYSGLSRAMLKRLMDEGTIKTVQDGQKRLVTRVALDNYAKQFE